MRILTREQMQACDEMTYRELLVPSRAVLEVAGSTVSQHILSYFSKERLARGLVFLCGSGNNAGDAYVAARILLQRGMAIEILSIVPRSRLTGDAKGSLESFERAGGVFQEFPSTAPPKLRMRPGIIVDGIFGTGLSRQVDGIAEQAIVWANQQKFELTAQICSIDVPSGVYANTGEVGGVAVAADTTLSFQALKMCHVLSPAREHCGEVLVSDIGVKLFGQVLAGETGRQMMDIRALQDALRPFRKSDSLHKGSRGHVLVVGGAPGKSGAPDLSARGALRAGAGLSTVLSTIEQTMSPQETLEIMRSDISDALSDEQLQNALRESLIGKKAVVVGPGLGTSQRAAQVIRLLFPLLRELDLPTVIDADALNIIAQERLRDFPPRSVLTPHPGEMARLTDSSVKDVESQRFRMAETLAQKWGVAVVLKGAMSIVASSNQETFVSPHAHSSLATAGSGDVLSGVIGGFLAQGLDLLSATNLAVYLHGDIGRILELRGQGKGIGILAHEIADLLPTAIDLLLEFESKESSRSIVPVLSAKGLSAV